VKPRGLVVENGVTLHFENGRTRCSCTPWPAQEIVISKKHHAPARVVMLRLLRGHQERAADSVAGLLACGAAVSGFGPPANDLHRFTLRSLPAPERPYRRPSRYSSLVRATARLRVAWCSVWCHWMQLKEQVERCYPVRLPQPKEWRNGYYD
jgi:hypothetical protein